eukprot:SAG31_NODE_5333_length_2603_cov_1.896565_1_plen_330_part_00
MVNQLEEFNQKCLDRYDVPELIGMSTLISARQSASMLRPAIYFLRLLLLLYVNVIVAVQSMSEQGCAADATLDAEESNLAEEEGHGFGNADGVGHYALELGVCDFDHIQDKVDSIDRACCGSSDADDSCGVDSVPSECDLECAIHYVPFHEDCNPLLQGTWGDQFPAFEALYGLCMTNSRRDVSGLVRTMSLTNDQFDSETCQLEGALNFNADCPNKEKECLMEYIGANETASSNNVFMYYRLYVTENFGANNLCLYELLLYGENYCLYDMREEAAKLQADQELNCMYTSDCSTNANQRPRCLIDNSLVANPAGGCVLSRDCELKSAPP